MACKAASAYRSARTFAALVALLPTPPRRSAHLPKLSSKPNVQGGTQPRDQNGLQSKTWVEILSHRIEGWIVLAGHASTGKPDVAASSPSQSNKTSAEEKGFACKGSSTGCKGESVGRTTLGEDEVEEVGVHKEDVTTGADGIFVGGCGATSHSHISCFAFFALQPVCGCFCRQTWQRCARFARHGSLHLELL